MILRKWVLTTSESLADANPSYTRRYFTGWRARVEAAAMNRGYSSSREWIVVYDPAGQYAISTTKKIKNYDREKYKDHARRACDVKVYRPDPPLTP